VAAEFGRAHPGKDGAPREVLKSVTTFVGGGGPRFWSSVSPEQQQLNYAQMILETYDKHDTRHLLPELQRALSAAIPGARVDARELEVGKPVGVPVAIRITGQEIPLLRSYAEKVKEIFRSIEATERIRDDWGAEKFVVTLQVDPDRANLAGVSNQDIAGASVTGMNGYQLTTLRDGDKQIPVLARLRLNERAQLSDIQDLYVYSSQERRKYRCVRSPRSATAWRPPICSGGTTSGRSPSPASRRRGASLGDHDLRARAVDGAEEGSADRLHDGDWREEEEQVKGFANLAVAMGSPSP